MSDHPQRSDEWFQEHIGRVTGSRFGDVMSYEFHEYVRGDKKGTTEFIEKAGRRNYRTQKVLELLGIKPDEGYQSRAMRDGVEREWAAKQIYQYRSGNEVEDCGLIIHPEFDWCGCSPDGLVGADGVVEGKALTPGIHLAVIRSIADGILPAEYMPQVQGHLFVTGRKWCDFVAYSPQFPYNACFACLRVGRDEEYLMKLREGVEFFWQQVQEEYDYVMTYEASMPEAA